MQEVTACSNCMKLHKWMTFLLYLSIQYKRDDQNTIKELPSKIQPYWTFREELTIEDGLILKGTE